MQEPIQNGHKRPKHDGSVYRPQTNETGQESQLTRGLVND